MFAICIESSHTKGMGHLFRMLNFAEYLKNQNEAFIFLINDNREAKEILDSKHIRFETVDLNDVTSDWENTVIHKYGIQYWLNDRLDTCEQHARNIDKNDTKLITFDDLGSGAKHSHINICGLFFNHDALEGKSVLKGVKYLILNSEIDRFKRERTTLQKIIITLGGSDTYGVTVKIVKLLKQHNIAATIHLGPSFAHEKELADELNENYSIIRQVPSLIAEFNRYDLAITGGGVTPFEANASGLPCLVIANELFEIPNGQFLEQIGSSQFLGHHANINETVFENLQNLNLARMSKKGMDSIDTDAVKQIYKEIKKL